MKMAKISFPFRLAAKSFGLMVILFSALFFSTAGAQTVPLTPAQKKLAAQRKSALRQPSQQKAKPPRPKASTPVPRKPAPPAPSAPVPVVAPVVTPVESPAVEEPANNAAAAAEASAMAGSQGSANSASYFELGFRFLLAQETVQATRTGTEDLLTQTQGTAFGLRLKSPFKNIRWQLYQALEVGMGTIRAQGLTTNIPDQIVNPWYSFTYAPGLIYRTAPPSDFGISFPIGFRIINWPKDDSTLTLSREKSMGYGIAFHYVNHLTTASSLAISFTHQIAWQSTVWGVGYDYAFR